jgi:UDP-N-acetyl-D-mannosaminuronic acid dehydrogenase
MDTSLGNMSYDIVIIGGLGHVGLPLGLAWAEAGLKVGALDVDQAKMQTVRSGKLPFLEYDAEPILKKVIGKQFFVLEKISEVSQAKAVVITIGTPVDEYLTPQLFVMTQLAKDLAPHLRSGQHIILRSTIYPGTSERLKEIFESLKLNLHLSFCPERIVQGHAIKELKQLPHIISSFTPEGKAFCREIFSKLGPNIIEVGIREAELAKLFSNTWRYVTFALANQFYMMAEDHKADIRETYRAMTEGYPRAKDIPKPGFAAGPCLLKDTMQLCAFYSQTFNLGFSAMQVNEGLPSFCVQKIRQKYNLRGMKVGLLGMAFKPDIDDTRDSLSFKLRKLLSFHGAEVLCTDEYVSAQDFLPLDEVLQKGELFIVGVPHQKYKTLKFPEKKPVFNIWNLDSCQNI